MTTTHSITLPFPPSSNHRLGMKGKQFYKTSDYKRFEQIAHYTFMAAQLPHFLKGSQVAIRITAHPPDLRKRDLDGLLKVTLDQFQKEGVVYDDYDFWSISIQRGPVHKPDGKITCELSLLTSNNP